MTPLPVLWLPILVSAVIVFIASNVLWMALPFWHRKDYKGLPDEGPVMSGLAKAASGQYMAPMMDFSKVTPEEREAIHKGPMALMWVRNPATFNFGKLLALYLAYAIVVSVLVAYISGVTLAPGTHYLRVFRVAGTAAVIAYAFRGIPDSIWYGKPWGVTFKELIDGVIYGLLTAGTFGWLWPH